MNVQDLVAKYKTSPTATSSAGATSAPKTVQDLVAKYKNYQAPPPTPDPTKTTLSQKFFGNTGGFAPVVSDIKSDIGTYADSINKTNSSNQNVPSKALQDVGAGANLIGSAAVDLVKPAIAPNVKEGIKNVISKVGSTPAAQALKKAWDGFAQAHPEASGNLGALGNIGSIAVPGGEGEEVAGKAVEAGAKAADIAADATAAGKDVGKSVVKKLTNPLANKVADATPDIVKEGASRLKNNVKNYASDLKDDANMRSSVKAASGPKAAKVVEETGSPEFVNIINNTKSKEDLAAKREMLDVASQRLNGTASSKLPRQVVADKYIVPRVNALQERLKDLGKTIGNYGGATDSYGKAIAKQKVDTTDIFNSLVKEAKKQGVIVNRGTGVNIKGIGDVVLDKDTGLTFSKAPGVSGIDQSRLSSIKSLFEGFVPNKTGRVSNTIEQLGKTRKNLSDLTKRTDAAKEVVAPGGPIDNTRRLIAKKISPAYYKATKDYSDIARTLEQLDPDFKVSLSSESAKDLAGVDMSNYARRLLSNNAAKAKSVFSSLDELYAKEAARRGMEVPKQDLSDLVDFAGSVEEGFGITPRNTFFGQAKGAIDSTGHAAAAMADLAGGHGLASAANTVKNIALKGSVNSKRALQAMKDYMDEVISKR